MQPCSQRSCGQAFTASAPSRCRQLCNLQPADPKGKAVEVPDILLWNQAANIPVDVPQNMRKRVTDVKAP